MKIFLLFIYFLFYFCLCLGQPTQQECKQLTVRQSCGIVHMFDTKMQQLTSEMSNFRDLWKERNEEMTRLLKGQNEEIARLREQIDVLNNTVNSGKVSMENCAQLYKAGNHQSGVYTLNISYSQYQHKSIQVYCDMDTPGGGWTVFQRRQDGSVSFAQNWNTYKHGFGQLDGEHWLGNDILSVMAAPSKANTLRVEFEKFSGDKFYAEYQIFAVDTESQNYKLTVESYSGTAGDLPDGAGLLTHNGMMFSTFDRDNDSWNWNCAATDGSGGFWYHGCDDVGPNGVYRHTAVVDDKGIHWHTNDVLKFFEMKFRPTDCC